MRYFATMQPRFIEYIRKQDSEGMNEGYVLLNKELKEINPNDILMRKIKQGEEIHIVPAVFGGGGKRGGLLAVAALVAVFIIAPQLAPVLAQAGVPGAQAFATTAATEGVFAAVKGSAFLSSVMQSAGLALLSAIFTKKPEKADENSRNNMFGALKNTAESGTPVPIHYGMVRTGGQFISGYIQTIQHGKGVEISVSQLVDRNSFTRNATTNFTIGLTNTLYSANLKNTTWTQRTIDISGYGGALARVVFKSLSWRDNFNPVFLDTISFGGNLYNFEGNIHNFESSSIYGASFNDYENENHRWISVDKARTSFRLGYGDAQSGSTYLYSTPVQNDNNLQKFCWLRSPIIELPANPTLTFYDKRDNDFYNGNLEVYLDILW
jgi:predicted phage tail protein